MKEPKWVEPRSVLAIHDGLLTVDGGAPGVRDWGLLESALARPRKLYAYANKPDIFTLAAAYTAGIVKNHQFLDGNKRSGFVVGVIFLIKNGYDFTASEESAAQVVLSLAAGELDETAFAAWMRENSKRRAR